MCPPRLASGLVSEAIVIAALKPGNHRIGRHEGKAVRSAGGLAATLLALLAAGCAAAPLDEAGSLASYNDLKPSDGLLTRSLVAVSKDRVLAAKTIKIAPTAFSAPAVREPLTPAQRHLVVNAVDRALCEGLSERFEVVGPSDSADLTVHAVVTHIAATNAVAAAVSKGASVAVGVALPGVPVPVPRIPVGLGSLSLEAEARDQDGAQQAAMILGRGANAVVELLGTGRPRRGRLQPGVGVRRGLQQTPRHRDDAVRQAPVASVDRQPAHGDWRKAEICGLRGVWPFARRRRISRPSDRGPA